MYAGEWEYGSMQGYGEYTWREGKKYLGYYNNNKQEGFGICYNSKPLKIYIGFWKNGKNEGISKYISNHSIKYIKWDMNRKDAVYSNNTINILDEMKPEQRKFYSFFCFDINKISLLFSA